MYYVVEGAGNGSGSPGMLILGLVPGWTKRNEEWGRDGIGRGLKWSETDKLRLSSRHSYSKLGEFFHVHELHVSFVFVQSVACPSRGETRVTTGTILLLLSVNAPADPVHAFLKWVTHNENRNSVREISSVTCHEKKDLLDSRPGKSRSL